MHREMTQAIAKVRPHLSPLQRTARAASAPL